MFTSKMMVSIDVWTCTASILFLVLECERDLQCLESLGLEGGLQEEVYFGIVLSLE